MCDYLIKIKASANFQPYSRRGINTMFNLQIDEDVIVNIPQGTNFMINNQLYRIGNRKKVNNNYEALLPVNMNFLNDSNPTNFIVLKKDTKYLNNNFSEDNLGFTKKLKLDQKVIFCNGVVVELPAGTPFHTPDGNLEFTIKSETNAYLA
jgi:hypothetical protein